MDAIQMLMMSRALDTLQSNWPFAGINRRLASPVDISFTAFGWKLIMYTFDAYQGIAFNVGEPILWEGTAGNVTTIVRENAGTFTMKVTAQNPRISTFQVYAWK